MLACADEKGVQTSRMKRSFVLVSFGLFACSGPAVVEDASAVRDAASVEDAGARDAGGAGDLANDYCAPLAEVVCASAVACGCGATVPGGTLDSAACVAHWTSTCLAAWQPFVEAGATIDAVAARACVELVRDRTPSCARPDGALVFAVCEPFAVEGSAIGDRCATPYCASGAGACVSGTCVSRGARGAPCSDMFSCATGLACNEGVCTAFASAGDACDADLDCAPPLECRGGTCTALRELGEPCADTVQCAIGLVCEGAVCAARPSSLCTSTADCGNRAECGGVRACLPRRAAAASCIEDRDCETSLFCDEGSCAARPELGQSCARGTICAEGLGCDTDGGTCRALPTVGQPCAFGASGPVLCASGLACLGDVCGALPAEGERCALDNTCGEGLGCDFSPAGSFCIVPRGEGGACESDRSCAAAFHCGTSGTCVADLEAGAPCAVGNECAGVCGAAAGGGLVCMDAPGAGDPCIFADECPSELRCGTDAPVCIPEICREL